MLLQANKDATSLRWLIVFGIADFVLIQLREPTYLVFKAWMLNIPVDSLILYYDMWPEYARIGWVMNAFGGLAGSILLVFRDRCAVWMFGVSIAGLFLVSCLFYLAPFPRFAGDRWGESLEIMRTALAMVSGLHSFLVIVAINRFAPQSAPR